MPYTKNGTFYACTSAHGFADRADGRRVIQSGGKFILDPPLPMKKKFPRRITVKKHERKMAVLQELLNKTIEELKYARVELMLEKWATGNWRANYKSVRSRLEQMMSDIRYAHSNVRAGNVEAAGRYLDKARKVFNQ